MLNQTLPVLIVSVLLSVVAAPAPAQVPILEADLVIDKGEPVHDATFIPGSDLFVAGGRNGEVVAWRMNGDVVYTFFHLVRNPISAIAASPDGRKLATAAGSPGLLIWDASTGMRLDSLRGNAGSMFSAAFGPDPDRLATGGGVDGRAIVWDLEQRDTVLSVVARRAGPTRYVTSVAFSRDGEMLVTAGSDSVARVWAMANGRELASFGKSRRADWSRDGRYVVGSFCDSIVRIYSLSENRLVRTIETPHPVVINAVVSPAGDRLLTIGSDGDAAIWDFETGGLQAVLRGHSGVVYSGRFNADGSKVVTSGADSTVRLWSLGPSGASPDYAVDRGLSLSPNPARDRFQLTIESPTGGSGHVRIYDAIGRLVSADELFVEPGRATVLSVQTKDLPAGHYDVRVECTGWQASIRLIIER